jgi:hypothetical protein
MGEVSNDDTIDREMSIVVLSGVSEATRSDRWQRNLGGPPPGAKGRGVNGDSKGRKGRVIVLQGVPTPVECSETLALSMPVNENVVHRRTVQGKPCEGKPHARFNEGLPETGWLIITALASYSTVLELVLNRDRQSGC